MRCKFDPSPYLAAGGGNNVWLWQPIAQISAGLGGAGFYGNSQNTQRRPKPELEQTSWMQFCTICAAHFECIIWSQILLHNMISHIYICTNQMCRLIIPHIHGSKSKSKYRVAQFPWNFSYMSLSLQLYLCICLCAFDILTCQGASIHLQKQNGSILTYEIEGHQVFRREGGAEVRVEQLEHSGLPLLFFQRP